METEPRNFSTIIVEAMRTKSFSVEKLSQLTGISDRYLAYILDDDLKKLPASPYVHGYVVKIAEALSMDGEALWQEYLKGSGAIRRSGKNDMLPQNRFITPQFNKKAVAGAAIVIAVIVYIVWRLPVLRGTPEFTLFDIQDMMVVTDPTFTISGKMNPADRLTINNLLIYPDQNGAFSKVFELRPNEFNPFEFKAQRFLGREIEVTKNIFYKAPTSTSNGTTQENL